MDYSETHKTSDIMSKWEEVEGTYTEIDEHLFFNDVTKRNVQELYDLVERMNGEVDTLQSLVKKLRDEMEGS